MATDNTQAADARAENYWAARERRNAKRRADYAEAKTRHICCQCKSAPVMKEMNHGGGHCSACDIEIRKEFSAEDYERIFR